MFLILSVVFVYKAFQNSSFQPGLIRFHHLFEAVTFDVTLYTEKLYPEIIGNRRAELAK